MKKVFGVFMLLVLSASFFSCSKNETDTYEPIRDYTFQNTLDMYNIENYLKSHYIEVINHPGFSDDMDVSITKIPSGGTQVSIWDQTDYPLMTYTVGIEPYKIYYLKLREGFGPNSKSPTNVDSVLASYKGTLLDGTVFDSNTFPQTYFNLTSTVRGWSEMFPQFKTGSYTTNTDGTITYSDFGAGVMFLPSALGYYEQSLSTIPAYSPLVFSFKLYEIQRNDQDGDGIMSVDEDLNHDGYLRDNETTYEDDSDHDGTPNYLDIDDDGDGVITKNEIKDPLTGSPYAFDLIPDCSGDNSDPNRIKKHLDIHCH